MRSVQFVEKVFTAENLKETMGENSYFTRHAQPMAGLSLPPAHTPLALFNRKRFRRLQRLSTKCVPNGRRGRCPRPASLLQYTPEAKRFQGVYWRLDRKLSYATQDLISLSTD